MAEDVLGVTEGLSHMPFTNLRGGLARIGEVELIEEVHLCIVKVI